jgi:ABC-type transporter Mla subunit MlaD
MRIDIHHHLHFTRDESLAAKLDELLAGQAAILTTIRQLEVFMRTEIDNLNQEVSGMNDAVQAADRTLEKLAQMIRDNADSPAMIRQIADTVSAQRHALAESILRNTPGDVNQGGDPADAARRRAQQQGQTRTT